MAYVITHSDIVELFETYDSVIRTQQMMTADAEFLNPTFNFHDAEAFNQLPYREELAKFYRSSMHYAVFDSVISSFTDLLMDTFTEEGTKWGEGVVEEFIRLAVAREWLTVERDDASHPSYAIPVYAFRTLVYKDRVFIPMNGSFERFANYYADMILAA